MLLDKEKQKQYVPGYVDMQPMGYYRSWYGYYQTVYNRVYTPEYYITNTTYMWESNLYDLKSTNLIYSEQSQSFDPNSMNDLASSYGKVLVRNMQTQGLIPKKQTN